MPSHQLHPSGKLAYEAVRRFPAMPTRSLARYLSVRHPGIYKCEATARTLVRQYRGEIGIKSATTVPLVPRMKIPESLSREKKDWQFPDGKWLLIGDLHVPFHDVNAVVRAFADAKENGVTGVFIGGDFQDCEGVGFFFDPTIRRDFLHEVEATIDFLDYMRGRFRKLPIVVMPGNHEERLTTYYARNAPVLANLPTSDMEHLLCLESRGITMLERRQPAIAKAENEAGDLHVLHGHTLMRGAASPVSPARTAMLKAKANTIIFHVHRESYHPEKTMGGRTLACWSVGCLCNLNPDYNQDANNWSHSHAFLEVSGTDWEVTLRRHLRDGRIV